MQEIHSIGGGDRRLRPQHHQNHQALKCPRCDSLNTKFCYYNNYNLSQPRHFCKSCRRYWTKGGVLRNVPVGGGSRKSKRSKPKSPPAPPQQDHHHNSNSHSSSESSSLTAAATEAVSAPSSTNGEAPESLNDSNRPSSKADFESGVMEQQGGGECGIFSEIASFSSLMSSMTTTTNEAMSFGFGNISEAASFRFAMGNDLLSGEWEAQAQHKAMGMSAEDIILPDQAAGSVVDQTVPIHLSAIQSKAGNQFGGGYWQGGVDQGLFDLPSSVDHAYWTDQHNPSLFHFP